MTKCQLKCVILHHESNRVPSAMSNNTNRMKEILRFQPILKQTLWGGDKIIPFKRMTASLDNVGESWELSGVADNESRSVDQPSVTLNHLVSEYRERLLGRKNYERFGNEFPLLIKFIDARQNLSIQVHPNDETAHRQGKTRGKTEMWYLMESAPGAQLYSGLRQQLTPEQYKAKVADDTICDALSQYAVKEDDVFFLPAGRIHAIGAGCFLAEIQQTSDVTYRIYDFKRRDKDGNYRQLHTKEAAEAIDYTVSPDYRTAYTPKKNAAVKLVDCTYFTTSIYDIDRAVAVEAASLDSFVILIGLKGEGRVKTDGEQQPFAAGDTLLIPAENRQLEVEGQMKFLEVHIT